MSIEHVAAMALNTNLTGQEFEAIAQKQMSNQQELVRLMVTEADKLPLNERVNYISFCLPFIF